MHRSNSRRRSFVSAWTQIGSDRRAGVRRSVSKALVVPAALVVLASCFGDDAAGIVHDLTMSVSASTTTAAVGIDVDFSFEATGPSVMGVIVDFGDGLADSVETFSGVNSLAGVVTHAFLTEGNFLVEGIVVDALDGRLSDTLFVDITP